MRILSFVLLFVALATPSIAQPDGSARELSWRVGATVDSLEREYFGLYPSIKGFRSMEFNDAGDFIIATISRSVGGDTTVTIPPPSFAELARYVNEVERVHAGTTTIDWSTMPPVRVSRQFDEGADVTVELRDGSSISGELAVADERGLVLWRGDDGYDPVVLRQHVEVVPFAAIDRVHSGSHFLIGAAAGISSFGGLAAYLGSIGDEPAIEPHGMLLSALIGGVVGGTAATLLDIDAPISGNQTLLVEILPRLQQRQMFFAVPAPELARHADSAYRFSPSTFSPVSLEDVERGMTLSGVSIAAAVAPAFGFSASPYPVEMSFNRKAEGSLTQGSIGWRAEVAYELLPWMSIGAGAFYHSAFRSDTTTDQEWVSALSPLAIVELNARARRSVRRPRVEVVAGFGGGVMSVTHSGQLPSGYGSRRTVVESSHTVPFGLGRLLINFNSTQRLVFFAGVEARIAAPLTVPYYEYQKSDRPELRFKWVPEHDISLSSAELQLGMKVRL
jgi:hypothetical protein